jgi:methionyl-tRNA synthetase
MKKDTVSYSDFEKLDLRVGEVKEATAMEGSNKLLKLLVDLGEDYGQVQILSGIAKLYTPEMLVGNKYIFLSNLEPRQIMGLDSNGMMMVAEDPEKFALMPLDKTLKNGTVIR